MTPAAAMPSASRWLKRWMKPSFWIVSCMVFAAVLAVSRKSVVALGGWVMVFTFVVGFV